MTKHQGKIIIAPGLNIWPHEMRTAESLAEARHVVEFVRKSEVDHVKTADTLIDGESWEFKSPTAENLKAVERNLKRGRWQSKNIVFDCRRMKKVPDEAIQREVRKQSNEVSGISRLLYINKHGKVIDIK